MNICLVGINHNTAPVAIREKVAIGSGKLEASLQLLRSHASHGIILSTCNRTEVYTIPHDDSDTETASFNFLRAQADAPAVVLLQHAYFSKNEAAVEHLFRVASGLDSMIIGEFEILGQVRQALEVAEKAKLVNLPLRHLLQSAIRTGRRVREETGISKNALSVSSVAVDMATRVVGDLGDCKMLIIGTGEAGRLVAKSARDRGISRIVVASRTQQRASALAEMLGGKPISLNNLAEELNTCNIVITCAGSPRQILDLRQVKQAMKARPDSPLVIIDIAVPRNVAPAVSKLNNVFLYNIDDLTQISTFNREQREEEIHHVEKIMSAELARFAAWWQDFKVRPLIRAMMGKAEQIRRSQLERTVNKLPPMSDEERYNLEMMTKAIVTKILKAPIDNIKANGHSSRDYAEMVKELFQLPEEKRE